MDNQRCGCFELGNILEKEKGCAITGKNDSNDTEIPWAVEARRRIEVPGDAESRREFIEKEKRWVMCCATEY